MSRKSQMAIFMILGIVAVLLIGLAYYGVSQATTSSLKSGKSQMEELFVGKGKYTTYIKSCLDQATKQALLLAGQQGGAIYDDEVIGGKPVASSRFYLFGAARIHYALNAPSAPTKSSSAMLAYPYYDVAALPTKPYLNTDVKTYSTSQSYTPFYSIPDPMVALCDGFGKNSENGIGAQYVYCSNFDSNVDPSIHNSVQEYLQNYIAKKTDECTKLETLPELQGYNIQKKNVSVDVIFGESKVISKLNMNISISIDQETPAIEIKDVSVEKKIRLMEIYNTLKQMKKEDSRNIFYDITNTPVCSQTSQMPCLTSNMIVEKEQIMEGTSKGDWIVRIVDTDSLIDGKSFAYQTVLDNRYPALDYIEPYDTDYKYKGDYDAVLVEGMTLAITPFAYDPDEDNYGKLGYMEKGYKYEFVGGYKEFKKDKNSDGNPDCLPKSSHSLNVLKDELAKCQLLAPSSQPAPTGTVGKDLIIELKEKHAGEHIIKVSACDILNQCDWQILKILVVPKYTYANPDGSMPSSLSIDDYKINSQKIFSSDTSMTATIILGKNQVENSSFSLPAQVQGTVLVYNAQNYIVESKTGTIQGLNGAINYVKTITDENSQSTFYVDANNKIIGFSLPGGQPQVFSETIGQNDKFYSTYQLAQGIEAEMNAGNKQDSKQEEQKKNAKVVMVYQSVKDLPDDERGYYYFDTGDSVFPQIYIVTDNFVDNGLTKAVPNDDPFMVLLNGGETGKPDLYFKNYFSNPSGEGFYTSSDGTLYYILNDGCSQGTFHKGYCQKPTKCIFGISLIHTQDEKGNYVPDLKPEDVEACITGKCTANGCE